MVHGYSFSEDSWGESVGPSKLLNLSELLESNETGTVVGIDLEQILTGAEHDYIFIEWVLSKGGTEFTSGIIGECLTRSGITAIEEIIDNAKFTMGQSGNTIERMTTTVKFAAAGNGIVPILLFVAILAITILFVFMTVFYKGKPAEKTRPLVKGKDKPVPLPVGLTTQGTIEESPEPQESTSSFWGVVWFACFIFPPFLLLAGPVYLVTRLPKRADSSDQSKHYLANQYEFSIKAPIREAMPEDEDSEQPDVPWWEIDKLI